ncbi:unnamed protein product [Caenorhabditis nigoni]
MNKQISNSLVAEKAPYREKDAEKRRARECRLYWGEAPRVGSVDEYFYIKYGITLLRPDAPLVAFVGSNDERNSVISSSMFPKRMSA